MVETGLQREDEEGRPCVDRVAGAEEIAGRAACPLGLRQVRTQACVPDLSLVLREQVDRPRGVVVREEVEVSRVGVEALVRDRPEPHVIEVAVMAEERLGYPAFIKKSIGLKKIPPPIPTIPETKPRIEPINIEVKLLISLIFIFSDLKELLFINNNIPATLNTKNNKISKMYLSIFIEPPKKANGIEPIK